MFWIFTKKVSEFWRFSSGGLSNFHSAYRVEILKEIVCFSKKWFNNYVGDFGDKVLAGLSIFWCPFKHFDRKMLLWQI